MQQRCLDSVCCPKSISILLFNNFKVKMWVTRLSPATGLLPRKTVSFFV